MSQTVEHGAFTVESNTATDAATLSASLSGADEHFGVASKAAEAPTPEPAADDAGDDHADGGDSDPNPVTDAAKTLNKAKRDKVQERIDKAVAAQRGAEREREAARAEAHALKQQVEYFQRQQSVQPNQAQSAPTDKQVKAAVESLPTLDKYESIEAWMADVSSVLEERAERRVMGRLQQESQRIQAEQQAKTINERIETFKASTPDYDDVVNAVIVPDSHAPVVYDYLRNSAMAPELAYELAKDRKALASVLSQSTPMAVLAALAKVEGRLEARKDAAVSGSAPAPKLVVSNAKPPIKPLGVSPSIAEDAPDEMPFSPAYIAEMNKRDRQARRVR